MEVVFVYKGVVGNNGASYGIFQGHKAVANGTRSNRCNEGIKRQALVQCRVGTKKLGCYLVVVRASDSLYRNFCFHCFCYFMPHGHIKKPRTLAQGFKFVYENYYTPSYLPL